MDTPKEREFRKKHGDEVVVVSNALVAALQALTPSATVGLNGLMNAMLIVICDQTQGDIEAAKRVKNQVLEKITDEALETFYEGHKRMIAEFEAQRAQRRQ